MGPSKQQQQQQQLANIVSKVAQIQEGLVEQEIEKYDTILQQTTDHAVTMTSDNTDDNNHNDNSSNSKDPILQEWRQKRIMEYQARQQELIQCRQTYGHGEYMELGNNNSNSNNTIDIAKEFFQICKLSPRIVIHCYRPTTELCHIFHTHLQLLAIKHMETRFLKFNVHDYNASSEQQNNNSSRGQNQNIAMKFLIEKLQIRVMPTLILIQNQQILHRMEGCTELNNNIQFTTNFLAHVLGHKYHMLYPTPDEIPDQIVVSNTKKNNTRHSSYLTSNGLKGTTRYRYNNHDDDEDEEDF